MNLCAYVHADEVSGSETQQACLGRLWPLWWSVRGLNRPRQKGEYRLSDVAYYYEEMHRHINPWANIHTAHTESISTHLNTHIVVRHAGRVRWDEWAPLSEASPTFQCLEPFYLMNAPKKMTVPCIMVYGWTLWSRQLDITHNLSFYIIYFN